MLLRPVGRWVIDRIGGKIASGVEISRGRRMGRPFQITFAAIVWWACLGLLGLPEGAYTALMLAVRLILMVGVVWSICRIVDWACAGAGVPAVVAAIVASSSCTPVTSTPHRLQKSAPSSTGAPHSWHFVASLIPRTWTS